MRGYNEYIGARYVPVFDGDWDNTKEYEPLMIVSYQGNSYTSKTFVPKNADINNTTYWALTGNYNAQVEAYRQEVVTYTNLLKDSFVNPEMYGAIGDGITDDTNAFKLACESGSTVVCNKIYLISHIALTNDVTIVGSGTLKLSKNDDNSNKYIFYSNSNINIDIKGITFLGDYTGGYVDPWNETQVKSNSECVFTFDGCNSVNLTQVTFKNIYVNPAYLSDFNTNRFNAKGLALAKVCNCTNVSFKSVSIINGTGEAIEIDKCSNVHVDGGIYNSSRTSYLSVISCGKTLIENLTVNPTTGNSININSSNTILTNCIVLCDNTYKPTTIDISNEYLNRDYAELIGYTVKNVTLSNNLFIDSYPVIAGAIVTESHPNNFNQVDKIVITNNTYDVKVNHVLLFTNERNFGDIIFENNKIIGDIEYSASRTLITALSSLDIHGTLYVTHNSVNITGTDERPANNNGVIMFSSTHVNIYAKFNDINFINFIKLNSNTGIISIEKNTFKGRYFTAFIGNTSDVDINDNDILSTAITDGGSEDGCGAYFKNCTISNVSMCNNKFKGFNLFTHDNCTFTNLIFVANVLKIATTRANSGIRLVGITASNIKLISNTIITNQQVAITTGVGVTLGVVLINNYIIGGNLVITGDALTLARANNYAENWTVSVNTDTTLTLQ